MRETATETLGISEPCALVCVRRVAPQLLSYAAVVSRVSLVCLLIPPIVLGAPVPARSFDLSTVREVTKERSRYESRQT